MAHPDHALSESVPRRIVLNLIITGIAVVVTYGIGLLAKSVWGIAV